MKNKETLIIKLIIFTTKKIKETNNTTDFGYHITIEGKPYCRLNYADQRMSYWLTISGHLKNTFTIYVVEQRLVDYDYSRMIANLSTTLYILYISTKQSLANKIFPRGTAACKTNSDGDFLTIQFTLWLPFNDHEDNDEDYIQKVYDDTIYLLLVNLQCWPMEPWNLSCHHVEAFPLKKKIYLSVSLSFIY